MSGGDTTVTPGVSLASDLLAVESDHQWTSKVWKTGIKSIDAQFKDLFSGGRIVGIGGMNEEPHVKGDVDQGGITDLSVQIMATALFAARPSSSTARDIRGTVGSERLAAYIIAPPISTVISEVHARLEALFINTGLAKDSAAANALELLESVRLLQYFDLAGLAESLSEVSDGLFETSQGQGSEVGTRQNSCLLLVQGLDQTAAAMQRRSGLVQTCGLLGNLLNTITVLSRSYPRLLAIVEVGVEVVPGVAGGDRSKGEISSAFSDVEGRVMRLRPGDVVGGTLEKGLDVLIVVHDGFGKMESRKRKVVEVVKDRIGGGFGLWTIWQR